MKCQLIDGAAISRQIRKEIADKVASFRSTYFTQPLLAVVLVGEDPASRIYVKKKQQACEEVGILGRLVELPLGSHRMQNRIEETIRFLNEDSGVHGILVQLPLPEGLDVRRVFDLISPDKDVDVFNPLNVGRLVQGRPRLLPCTPHGIQQMLFRSGIQIAGKHVVVINRSDIVGKPLSSMLIQDNEDFANATVTVCHIRTPPDLLERMTKSADIVVVAVGKPDFLRAHMLSPGAVVVDVGINRVGGQVVGDCHLDCREVAGHLTPVPGGVGPMTVTMLLENTLKAAQIAVAQ